MKIEQYFTHIQRAIAACRVLASNYIVLDKRSSYEGFIRGDLVLENNSLLHFREYVNLRLNEHRLMYAYQYMMPDNQLVFRYDNAEHYQGISTFPHHKHEGSERNVVAANAPTLAQVLAEIELLVRLS